MERGLISVSGGKLTTFRLIALDVLRHAAQFIPSLSVDDAGDPIFSKVERQRLVQAGLDCKFTQRLLGRYGMVAEDVFKCAGEGELSPIPGTDTLWVELRWAARNEAVVHLEDLLLRRTRLGILLEEGGMKLFDRIKPICQQELGWNDDQWNHEVETYCNLWHQCHSVPNRDI
jgi:glycerol-3-phosphate dehydrogenase